jgi:glycosyltransferase involved in cell wall biosynthesis
VTRPVAVVLHEPLLGGASTALLRALPALEREGWSFCFWVPQPGPAAEALIGRGHRVDGARRHLRYSRAALREPPGMIPRLGSLPGYARAFAAFLRREDPRLVHLNSLLTLPEGLLARALGKTTLLHVHEQLPPDARGRAAARMARLMTGVVCVSEASAAPLRALGVETGVVTAGLPAGPPRDRSDTSRRVVVGTLATICHRKGSDLFVAMAERLLSHRSDVEFRLVGPLAAGRDAAWADALVRRAERAGITWTITTDAAGELGRWDVFVLPTRRDPFPLVVLEAMAAALPIVAFAVDGIPEQLGPDAGLLAPAGDAEALTRHVERLLDDPALRATLGQAAAARLARCFTPERQTAELVAAYRRALARAPRH